MTQKRGRARKIRNEDVPQLKVNSLQKLHPYKRGVVAWDYIASGADALSFKLEYETHPGYVVLSFDDCTQVIETTETHGHMHQHLTRAWFVCPGCAERRGALSLVGHFMCHRCHGLIYRSQSTSKPVSTTQHRRKLGLALVASERQTR